MSVGARRVVGSPAWQLEASVVRCSRPDDRKSWSLGGTKVEVVTGGVQTRRTHYGRPGGSPGAMEMALSILRFGFVCVLYGEARHRSQDLYCLRKAWVSGGHNVRATNRTDHV